VSALLIKAAAGLIATQSIDGERSRSAAEALHAAGMLQSPETAADQSVPETEGTEPGTAPTPQQPCTDPRHTGRIREQLGCTGPDPAEAQAEPFVPRTERSHWADIADALNAAHAAGMPVGIDLDGTLTDHNMWSVVWDREAERWTVAGYDGETHIVGDDSDDPEHNDDCPGCEPLAPSSAGVLPWARQLDPAALATFLNELGEAAIRHVDPATALGEVQHVLGAWALRTHAADLDQEPGQAAAAAGLEPYRVAFSKAVGLGTGAPWDAITARVTELAKQDTQLHDDLTGARLARWEEEQDNARLRARVRELESLDLGAVDGRVSAACEDPAHPTWLRTKDDARGCPWCRVAELEAQAARTLTVPCGYCRAEVGALCVNKLTGETWPSHSSHVARYDLAEAMREARSEQTAAPSPQPGTPEHAAGAEQLLALARQADDDDPICGDQYDDMDCVLEPGHDGHHQDDSGTAGWGDAEAGDAR
jgi:hypothetical protein